MSAPRTVLAIRYVTPLREGGSLPAIIEADDLGMYVLKFREAGQGPAALVAEWIGGEIGRALGLRVPDIVFVEVDAALGRNEADSEIREFLQKSVGRNLGMDYLPGSVMFDPAAGDCADPDVASRAVWFDAFITNVDRTAQNPNLLCWHKNLYFIDHGAALYFHHLWDRQEQSPAVSFPAISQHVLLRWASKLDEADAALRPLLTEETLRGILDATPDEWLRPAPEKKRDAYLDYFMKRLATTGFLEEAKRAHADLV